LLWRRWAGENASRVKQPWNKRKLIGNFKLSFETLNDNGQRSVTILPFRFSKPNPSNSPVRVIGCFWRESLNKNAYERLAAGMTSFNSRCDREL
jgi:hypothetical protein